MIKINGYNVSKSVYAAFGKKSDSKGLLIIVGDYFIIAIAILLGEFIREFTSSVVFFFFYAILCFVLASRYRAFEILVHEASHNNVFNTRRYNRMLQFLFAYPVFLYVQKYVSIHLAHHRLIGDFENDPDILIYKKWGLDKLPQNKLWILYIRPLILYFTFDYFRTTFLNFWKVKEERFGKLLYWVVILLIIWATNTIPIFLLYYCVPFLLLLPILRFYARANEHTGVDFEIANKSARNNIGFFHNYILHPHGDGYHQIHHLFPSVPFYNLSKVHQFLLNNGMEFLDSYNPIISLKFIGTGCTKSTTT
jgi:fatty acid desaturase